MRRRLTRRAFLLAATAGLLFLVATTAQAGWLFVLAAGVLGVVAASLVAPHRLAACEITRVVPARMRVGDEGRVRVEVRNIGTRSVPLMRVDDRHEAFGAVTFVCERLRAAERATATVAVAAHRRGTFTTGHAALSCGYPFGLVRSRRAVEVASPIIVVPRWVELGSFPLLEPSSYPAESLHERARIGAGLEYIGVREYRPGDSPRSIHWRSTARRGQLVVREFEEEGRSRVALVVAGTDAGTPPDSAFERLVEAAASIALYALVTGHPVDLLRHDEEVTVLSDPGRDEVLRWLAEARPGDEGLRGAVAAAVQRTGRRGTVVILAPSAGRSGEELVDATRGVQSSGARAVAVVARSWTWAGDAAPPEDELARLAKLGDRTLVRSLGRGEDLRRCLQG
jgi:uncharacterized protein (DUF58 family)